MQVLCQAEKDAVYYSIYNVTFSCPELDQKKLQAFTYIFN